MFKKTVLIISVAMLAFAYAFSQDSNNVAPFSISHGPYLQDVGESSATVVFTTNRPSFSWVEIIDSDGVSDTCYNIEHGVKMANNTFHTIRIDDLNLGEAYSYRLFSKEITKFDPYSVEYGDSIASDFYDLSTLDSSADELTFIEMSDIHGNNEKLEQLLNHTSVQTADMVLYAGDMMDYYATEEQPFHNFIDKSVEMFASETPFWLVRGNHETRGKYSRNLFRYFPREDGRYYYTVKNGPVFFIFLDSGEDKPDNHPVYAGLNDFDNYRAEQATWLRKVIASDEYKEAQYRIVVSHIPPIADGWHSEQHITETWLPILNDADIDLMLAGHTHEYKYVPAKSDIYDFPLIIGSNSSAAKVEVNKERIKVETVDSDGNVIDEIVL